MLVHVVKAVDCCHKNPTENVILPSFCKNAGKMYDKALNATGLFSHSEFPFATLEKTDRLEVALRMGLKTEH